MESETGFCNRLRAITGSATERALQHALTEACQSFSQGLELLGFVVDEERMLMMIRDSDAFQQAPAQLPYLPFTEIDTSACRELFARLGPHGASGDDFDWAWKALGRRFQSAAAEQDRLRRWREPLSLPDTGRRT
jgi:hypothetical protein